MFLVKSDKTCDRRYGMYNFCQFINSIQHVSGECNVVPDGLSRFNIEAVNIIVLPESKQMVVDQTSGSKLREFLDQPQSTSLSLVTQNTPDGPIYCDMSVSYVRSFVQNVHRKKYLMLYMIKLIKAFKQPLSSLSHAIVGQVWANKSKYGYVVALVVNGTRFTGHTISPVSSFAPTQRRYNHVHLDLVGLMVASKGCKYLLTCVDKFTRWPIAEMSAHTMALTLVKQ